MTARHLVSAFVISLALVLVPDLRAESAAAPDAAVPDVANGKRPLVGKTTATVYVRSGPGENYYPTAKLETGAEITVVGEKYEWLKITPPQGSFSYVAKMLIDKNADGTGTVNKDDVLVRTGSSLNAMKTSIQTKLEKGDKVNIIDEKEDYYLIKPPADAYVYVSKQFVEPVREATAAIAQQTPQTQQPQAPQVPNEPIAGNTQDAGLSTQHLAAPTTAPTDFVLAHPSTQPSVDVAFDQLEADFTAASGKGIEDQPVKDLLARYQKLLADPNLPESMKRVGDFRVRTLTARAQAKEQFAQVEKMEQEAKKKQQALKAEQEELAQQIKKNSVTLYAAIGTLRASSLQTDKTTLYRLTDPDTGRTVVYIRTSDPKYAPLIGKFIGVKGEITTDPALSMKVVNPTEVAEVQQSEVFKSIGAQIVPPSILPQAAQQASTGNQ